MQHRRVEWRLASTAVVLMSFGAWRLEAAQDQLEIQKELPTNEGWHAAKWGMTVQEVSRAIGSDFREERRAEKNKKASYTVRGKLVSKLLVDRMECKVAFGFNAADKFNVIYLECDKVKPELPGNIRKLLGEQYGEMYSYRRIMYPVAFAGEDPGVQRDFTWRQDNRLITCWTYEKGFGGLMGALIRTFRGLGITVSVPESEEAFGEKGRHFFAGEVQEKPGHPMSCSMEVNPLLGSIKVYCKKKPTLIDTKVAGDYAIRVGKGFKAGEHTTVHQLTFPASGPKQKPVKVYALQDLVELLRKTFPDNVK